MKKKKKQVKKDGLLDTSQDNELSTSLLSTEADESDVSQLHLSTIEGTKEETETDHNSDENQEQQSHGEIGGFTVIGAVQEKKLQKVKQCAVEMDV